MVHHLLALAEAQPGLSLLRVLLPGLDQDLVVLAVVLRLLAAVLLVVEVGVVVLTPQDQAHDMVVLGVVLLLPDQVREESRHQDRAVVLMMPETAPMVLDINRVAAVLGLVPITTMDSNNQAMPEMEALMEVAAVAADQELAVLPVLPVSESLELLSLNGSPKKGIDSGK